MCLRFVDVSSSHMPHIKECLLSFIYLERATATAISQKILETLTSLSIDVSNIRGQVYDGAAVMSSEIAGVQAKIKEVSPLALYTHCYSHCLNLSIAAACGVPEVRHLITLINQAYLFLNNSSKRQRMFEIVLKTYMPDCSHSKLPGLCKTRWVERHTCFEVFLEMYEPLITFLDAIVSPHEYPELKSSDGSWNWDKDTKIKAQGLKASLSSFQTIAVFLITKIALDDLKFLVVNLQKKDQDVAKAYEMIDEVVETVKRTKRTIDVAFVSWYKEIIELAKKVGVDETVPRKTSLMRNRSNTPSNAPREHYKRTVAIPLLDNFISQLEQRFSEEDRQARALLFLIPSLLLKTQEEHSIILDGLYYWRQDLPLATQA